MQVKQPKPTYLSKYVHSAGLKSGLSRAVRGVLFVAAVVLAVILVGLIVQFLNDRRAAAELAFENASAQALNAADSLSGSLGSAMVVTESVADDLSSGALPFDDGTIEARLRQILRDRPYSEGITVAFAPFAYSPDERLHIVYLSRDEAGEIVSQIRESRYDYTLPPSNDPEAPQTSWYHDPVNNGPTWSEPFLATGAGKVLVEYGVPFYQTDPVSGEQTLAGVVAQDYSLAGMRELVEELELGQTGYGATYTQSGTWLSHPIPEMAVSRTFYEGPQFQANPQLVEAAEGALGGERAAVSRYDPTTDADVWTFFAPIDSTDWGLVVQLDQSEFLPDTRTTLAQLVRILLVGATLLFVVLAIVFRVERAETKRLWAASLAFSIIAALVIVATIWLSRTYVHQRGVTISNRSTMHSYLENLDDEYIDRGLTPPVKIPTGIQVQSVRFPDSTSVVVTGNIWQRVPKVEGQEISAGFTLPQLIDEPMMVEEILREERANETYVVWSVVVALRQAFDPLEYPFDNHDIKIRLLPVELQRNALLVPDLQAYDVTVPGFLPGLESNVRINNWRILGSSFQFGRQQYKTNMSLPGRPTVDVPELSFDVITQRRFLGPFIAFLLPALVAALMIFAFLLNESKPDEPEEIVTALSYTAALFFVIAVMHTALRENAAAIGLTYLEYFYLLLYIMIVFVAINTFFVVRRPQNPVIRFGNNLISKLLFWPVVLSVMLVATVEIFV